MKKHVSVLNGAVAAAVVALVAVALVSPKTVTVSPPNQKPPCQNYDLLSPAARSSAKALAKIYPVHADPNNGLDEPTPAHTFLDSRTCDVFFAAVDRVKQNSLKPPPAGYGYWGGLETWDGLTHGPDQKVAKRGDTLRKLANWDGSGSRPVSVWGGPNALKQLTPGPDDPLAAGTIVVFN